MLVFIYDFSITQPLCWYIFNIWWILLHKYHLVDPLCHCYCHILHSFGTNKWETDSIWKKWNYYKRKTHIFQRRTHENSHLRNSSATKNLKIEFVDNDWDTEICKSNIILTKQTDNDAQINLKVCNKWNWWTIVLLTKEYIYCWKRNKTLSSLIDSSFFIETW